MKSAGKARSNGLYRHIRTSKEIIRNLLNDSNNNLTIYGICQTGLAKRKEAILGLITRYSFLLIYRQNLLMEKGSV